MSRIYIVGSLRAGHVRQVANALRAEGHEVFDDWHACHPDADEAWREYEQARGRDFIQALYEGHFVDNCFQFDMKHMEAAEIVVLVLPAGKSAHLELGLSKGRGKRTYILLEEEAARKKLPEEWRWLAGIYEGEGTVVRNGGINSRGVKISVSMKDQDIVQRLARITGVGYIYGPYKQSRGNPKHAMMYRWAVHKREDAIYVLKGIWQDLGIRRQEQIITTLKAAGISFEDFANAPGPAMERFDMMYLIVDRVCRSLEELIERVK